MRFAAAAAGSALIAAALLTACRPPDRNAPDTATPSATAQATQATANADASAAPAATAASADTAAIAGGSGAATQAAGNTVSITPTGLEMGDLFHITTREGGENSDLTVDSTDSLLPFLLAHRGQTIQATLRRVPAGSTDEQGLPQQAMITDASLNGQTAAQWWSSRSATERRRWSHEAECVSTPVGNAPAGCPAPEAR